MEVLSPGNRFGEMLNKFNFYDRHGVEEYYIFDPDDGLWQGWQRRNGTLTPIPEMNGWVSPRLTIRFESIAGNDLSLFSPTGERFRSMAEIAAERRDFKEHLELERLAREQAQQRASTAEVRASTAEEQAARLAAQLQAAGIEPSGK